MRIQEKSSLQAVKEEISAIVVDRNRYFQEHCKHVQAKELHLAEDELTTTDPAGGDTKSDIRIRRSITQDGGDLSPRSLPTRLL